MGTSRAVGFAIASRLRGSVVKPPRASGTREYYPDTRGDPKDWWPVDVVAYWVARAPGTLQAWADRGLIGARYEADGNPRRGLHISLSQARELSLQRGWRRGTEPDWLVAEQASPW